MTSILDLTSELIRRASMTPDDAGCQALIADRLACVGFAVEHLRYADVDNLWATHGSGAPVLVFLGLFTRFGALILLGVVTMIQTLVYPGHWAEHLLWASLLGLLLARGGGMISLDHIARRLFVRSM